MIVDYIDAHKGEFGVEPICRVLTDAGTKIAPSTYYAHRTRPPSARSVSDAATTTLIEKVHSDNTPSPRLRGRQPARAGILAGSAGNFASL